MKELFFNLIGNGIKFNQSKNPIIDVKCEDQEEDWLFMVHDNGIGIEKKYHDRIFALFERLHSKEEYPGTGAGLAICKRIIENFGGKIWVESQLGDGSTFYFSIPKKMELKK
jgi:chemotaxis family two-component system sensor kinase Cph1